MKNLCVISMLILSIVGNAVCQKTKSKYDTMTVLEGIRPPIMVNDFARKSDIYFNEDVKKNDNRLVIDFGNKNRLLIDYQGVEKLELKQNVDSLLQNFWQDYSLIRDTVNKNMVKKITYFGKNKNVNRKAMIDIQYFPQKEVFQFGKEVELVRLKQDTLVLINFDDKASSELAKTANRVFKTYEVQTFLFNLNTIEDIDAILETNINRAIAETAERAENERKTVRPWKILGVENDLASQRIRSKVSGNALFDFINFHADFGVGLVKGQVQNSATLAFDIASSSYFKRGFALGIQGYSTINDKSLVVIQPSIFTGITFYQRNKNRPQLKGGIFLGYNKFEDFNLKEKGFNLRLFGWYQLTPLIRIQPEMGIFSYNLTKGKPTFTSGSGFRISFGL
jgi:hypothetical protein